MIDSICSACGGEVIVRLRPEEPGVRRHCAACGREELIPLRPASTGRRILAAVARDRVWLRQHFRPVRPTVLLWLPRAPGTPDEFLDETAMLRERLADTDTAILLVEGAYPNRPDAPAAALAALTDLCLLVCPDPESLRLADRLLGEAVPPSRAVLLAWGTPDATPRPDRRRPVSPGSLFDCVTAILLYVRRLAFRVALDPEVAPGDLLFPDPSASALVQAIDDEVSHWLLVLVDRLEDEAPGELVSEAGDRTVVESSLARLEAAGLVGADGGGPRITSEGRRLLDLLSSRVGKPPRFTESPLARLFREARAGDRQARDRLLTLGSEEAERIAQHRLGPMLKKKLDSFDISQSVTGDLLSGFDRIEFRGDAAWHGYLRRLVENKIRTKADYYTAKKRDSRREQPLPLRADLLGSAAADFSPEEALQQKEERDRLEAALFDLPDAERKVLVLRIFEGRTHREIAAMLDRPSEGAVHKLYARALARLAVRMRRS